MPKDFIPSRDADLLPFSQNLSAKLTATPVPYGVTAPQATALAALVTAFATALGVATNPATRTRAAISAKDAAKTPLVANIRNLARVINAFPSITNTQRLDLGLTPRDGTASPIQPPSEAPVLEVVSAMGRTLKVKLHAQDSVRRGKPDGVDGATIFSFVGVNGTPPPADLSLWKFEGSSSRTLIDVEFATSVPAGSLVYLTAFWFNPRCQSGPACQPVSAYLAGGVNVSQQAA